MKKPVVRAGIGGAVLVLAGAAWWVFAYSSPTTAFDDMLANNLATPGVTRVSEQGNDQLRIAQYTQLQLGAQPTAHSLTILKRSGIELTTEGVSDRGQDFVRISKIVLPSSMDKAIDTSTLTGKWAKLSAGENGGGLLSTGLFDQALLGVLPIANLSPSDREALMEYIDKSEVFSFDASKVKTVDVGGRKAYSYDVSVKPAPYIKLMQEFGKLVDIHQYDDINANAYASSASIPLTIVVDARSHTLLEVAQQTTGRTDRYGAFGLMPQSDVPKATLTTKQLTELLAKLQQGSN